MAQFGSFFAHALMAELVTKSLTSMISHSLPVSPISCMHAQLESIYFPRHASSLIQFHPYP